MFFHMSVNNSTLAAPRGNSYAPEGHARDDDDDVHHHDHREKSYDDRSNRN